MSAFGMIAAGLLHPGGDNAPMAWRRMKLPQGELGGVSRNGRQPLIWADRHIRSSARVQCVPKTKTGISKVLPNFEWRLRRKVLQCGLSLELVLHRAAGARTQPAARREWAFVSWCERAIKGGIWYGEKQPYDVGTERNGSGLR
jgi:hypothetical protein